MLRIQMRMDAHAGPMRIHAGAAADLGTKAVSHRILDAQSRKVQAFERTALCRDIDLEGLLHAKPVFPRHGAGRGIQVVFLGIGRICQLHQHTLRQAAVQIQLQCQLPVALHPHAATLQFGGGRVVGSNGGHFVGQQIFHPGGAGQKQRQMIIHLQHLIRFHHAARLNRPTYTVTYQTLLCSRSCSSHHLTTIGCVKSMFPDVNGNERYYEGPHASRLPNGSHA